MIRWMPVLGLACLLHADPIVQGPRLGYLASGSTVRGLIGIVGASRLTGPLVDRLAQPVVLPGTDRVVGLNTQGALVMVDLKDEATIDLGVSDVTKLAASPNGQFLVASTAGRGFVFSNTGRPVVDFALPDSPIRIAVADSGPAVAFSIAESGGEALYLVKDQSSRSLFHASRLPAFAFLPNSVDLVVADDVGVISRLDGNLQFSRLIAVPGAHSLAATTNGHLLVVADRMVRTLRLATGEENSVACNCERLSAVHLSDSNVLLTPDDSGPKWILDVSTNALRLVFIPEVVNE